MRSVLWSDWLGPRVDRLLVGATLLLVVAYLLQALLQWVSWWSVAGISVPPIRPGDVGLTIGTVNAIALHLELLVPVAAWLAWRRLARPRLAGTIAGLGLFALMVTGSRGAWLGALAAVGCVAVIAWARAGRPMPSTRGRNRGPAVVLGLGAVVALVVLAPVLLPRLLSGDAGRWELWSAAWAMFTGQPLTGTGPGTFPLLRPGSPITEPNLAVLTTSHNSVLQVLVDGGVLAMAAAVWILVTVARLAGRAIRTGTGRSPELALVVVGSLVAMLVHSVVDTQFHVPAVVLLVFLLVARIDPPAAVAPVRPAASRILAGAVVVATGALLLVPIDAAMVRAQLGNDALDRGDAQAALEDFRWAADLHELAPYRLGEGIAASRLGDDATASDAFTSAQSLHGLTFIGANLATVAGDAQVPGILDRIEAAGAYDATAAVNAAVLRFPDDPAKATADLAAAMTGAPTLIYSERPPTLFDADTWLQAQRQALDAIGATDPVSAAALALLAGLDDQAAQYGAAVSDDVLTRALDMIGASMGPAQPDIESANALLREAPASPVLLGLLWQLGFQARSQALIDDVGRLAVPLLFGLPMPPLELVLDGRSDADYSLRIPRYPMASDFRNGPKRPYAAGMVTIEPVHRPK